MSGGAVRGDDGVLRCPWGDSSAEYRSYHDDEWGRPVGDDRGVLERLCLEGFQSGLSWLTILRKRAGFRAGFAGFEPEVVATFDERDVARLLGDAGIVRHRGKIEATIANARATVALRRSGRSLGALVWAAEPPPAPAPGELDEIPATTAVAQALSKDLKRLGFRFLGPTTVYAALQALGVVNDHVGGCTARAGCEQARAVFVRPV